jgi:hypothetical protein
VGSVVGPVSPVGSHLSLFSSLIRSLASILTRRVTRNATNNGVIRRRALSTVIRRAIARIGCAIPRPARSGVAPRLTLSVSRPTRRIGTVGRLANCPIAGAGRVIRGPARVVVTDLMRGLITGIVSGLVTGLVSGIR